DPVDLPKPDSYRAIETSTADTVADMLSGGESADEDAGISLYADNGSATWHSGFFEGIAISVWAGDSEHEGDGSSLDDTVAESMWNSVVDEAILGYPPEEDLSAED
ncbi:MAG: hypothetical protein ACRD0P_19165, partial [Stackebrandtia sp.]